MQQPTHPHPPWCQFQHAPADNTHVHTCAIGTTVHVNDDDVTIEASLTQEPGDTTSPTVVVHISGAAGNLSFDITGQQAWMLAGLFIDATLTHARTAPRQGAIPGHHCGHDPALVHVHPDARAGLRVPLRRSEVRPAGQRWLRRSFRCAPRAANRPDGEGGPASGPGPDGDAGPER